MLKELVICIIIVIAIFTGNNITQKYSKETIETLTSDLKILKETITKEQINENEVNDKLNQINDEWTKMQNQLAYFIEHDELEKVQTSLVSMKSFIENKKYEDSTNELDKNVFILKHIEDKYEFDLKNIF